MRLLCAAPVWGRTMFAQHYVYLPHYFSPGQKKSVLPFGNPGRNSRGSPEAVSRTPGVLPAQGNKSLSYPIETQGEVPAALLKLSPKPQEYPLAQKAWFAL